MYEPNRVERDEQQPAAGIKVKEGRSGDLEIVMTRLWNSVYSVHYQYSQEDAGRR